VETCSSRAIVGVMDLGDPLPSVAPNMTPVEARVETMEHDTRAIDVASAWSARLSASLDTGAP
jgi:hypothetical protein